MHFQVLFICNCAYNNSGVCLRLRSCTALFSQPSARMRSEGYSTRSVCPSVRLSIDKKYTVTCIYYLWSVRLSVRYHFFATTRNEVAKKRYKRVQRYTGLIFDFPETTTFRRYSVKTSNMLMSTRLPRRANFFFWTYFRLGSTMFCACAEAVDLRLRPSIL